MPEKAIYTPLRQAREALNKAHPDDVDDITITEPTAGVLHIEVTLHAPREEVNPWVRFADEMHEESPLRGKSEALIQRSQEFRKRFSFQEE